MKSERAPIWNPWQLIDLDECDIKSVQEQFDFELLESGSGPYTFRRKELPVGYFIPWRFFKCKSYWKCLLFADSNNWVTFFCPQRCSCFLERKD
jgi:hypothetical protein